MGSEGCVGYIYNAVKHLFKFPSLISSKSGKQCKFEQLGWKTFHNIFKHRGK